MDIQVFEDSSKFYLISKTKFEALRPDQPHRPMTSFLSHVQMYSQVSQYFKIIQS